MTDFVFTLLVNDPPATILSAALGTGANAFSSETDTGKGVKLGTSQNYVQAADGDEIEGVVASVEPWNVNDGFTFGTVQVDRRVEAVVGASQVGALAVGALVVNDVPVALNTLGVMQVKAGAPATYKWRVLRHVTGTGITGDTVLLERI